MSTVIEIRRPKAPFETAELERMVALHPKLSFALGQLTWITPEGEQIALNITPDEIWTDAPYMANGVGLDFLKSLAETLGAEVCYEGEPLTDDARSTDQQAVSPAKAAMGALVLVLAAPFLLLWMIIRLPWVLWQIKRGTK